MKAWFQQIWQQLTGSSPARAGEQDGALDFGAESGAHARGQTPDDLHKGRRRLKENYTIHWDLDYISRAEIERLLGGDD